MGSHGNGANQLSHGDLLISRELIESTLELIADRLVFLLLLDQVGFKFITFLLEFSGLSLALSGASLSVLESGAEIANGLLVRLFAGKGLSLGNFEGLHVVADDLQLFLQLLDLGFSVISALLGALKIHLQHRQTSGGLIIFSVRVLSDHLRFLERKLQSGDTLVIWKLKFSSTLRPHSDSSAALEASSNFSEAIPSLSSDLSRSSSTNWQRLWSADTSASDSWTCLLADSRLVLAVERFS